MSFIFEKKIHSLFIGDVKKEKKKQSVEIATYDSLSNINEWMCKNVKRCGSITGDVFLHKNGLWWFCYRQQHVSGNIVAPQYVTMIRLRPSHIEDKTISTWCQNRVFLTNIMSKTFQGENYHQIQVKSILKINYAVPTNRLEGKKTQPKHLFQWHYTFLVNQFYKICVSFGGKLLVWWIYHQTYEMGSQLYWRMNADLLVDLEEKVCKIKLMCVLTVSMLLILLPFGNCLSNRVKEKEITFIIIWP